MNQLKKMAKWILPRVIVTKIQQYLQPIRDYLWLNEQVFAQIPDNLKKEHEFEQKSQQILKKYKKIELCTIISHRIGEIICALGYQLAFPAKKDELAIFFPVGEGLHYLYDDRYLANPYLLNKMAKLFPIVTRENADFWKYFIQNYKERTYFSHRFDHSNLLQMQKKIVKDKNFHYPFSFDLQEKQLGETMLKKMDIQGEYVCFFSRSTRYLKEFLGYEPSVPEDFVRNSHLANYEFMAARLWSHGIQSVRMGYLVEGEFKVPGGIDYANLYRTEFMDFYVMSRAQFFVSDPSAMHFVANLFEKPIIMVNQHVFTYNADVIPLINRGRDIFLPKKMYDTEKNRYLTFKEIFAIERQEDSVYKIIEYYDAHGIVLEENTPDEIADAAEEMLERLNGTFEYTIEDEARQRCFSELLAWACDGRDCFVVDLPIGRDFLRQNEWILE